MIPLAVLLLLALPLLDVPGEQGPGPQEQEEDLLDDGLDSILGGSDEETPPGEEKTGGLPFGVTVTTTKGYLGTRFRSYLVDRRSGKRDEQLLIESEIELGFDLTEGLDAFLRPRFLVDILDSDLKRFEPYDAYLTLRGERWDLRGGQFVENWGIADTYNPIDLINRRDYAVDLLDPDRLGELGVRGRYFFHGGDVIGEPTVAAYAMPAFRRMEFPTQESRFSLSDDSIEFNPTGGSTPHGGERGTYALRVTHTLNTPIANADVQLTGARGPEHFPMLIAQTTAGGLTELVPVYYGAWTAGGGIRAVPNSDSLGGFLSRITFKVEAAYKWIYRFRGAPDIVPDDFLAYVAGVDYPLTPLFTDKDQLTLMVEYAGEAGASDRQSKLRPFRSDLVARLFWEAEDFSRTSVEARAIVDVKTAETILQGILERQLRYIHDDLKATVDVQWFFLNRGEESIFAFFPNNSSLTVGLRYEF